MHEWARRLTSDRVARRGPVRCGVARPGHWARRSTVGPADQSVMQTRITFVLSNVFELTVFFAAAAALGVGLLGLR